MKKGVIVVVNLFVFLLFLFAFFAQPVNAFSFGKSPPNPGNCVIKSISWDENFIGLGDKSKLIIKGENCNEKTVELNVFEKDFLFDDSVKSFEVSFANEVISVELDSSDLNYLFDEVFEGDGLEIYFEIGFDSRKEVSSVLTVSEDGVGLAPFEGGVDLEVINAPINLVATAQSATSVLLNWVDNSRNEDGFTLQYKLSSAPEGDWVDVPGASNLVTENSLGTGGTVEYLQTTGLTAGTSYDYRVNAHDNKGGVSLWSDAASTRTLDLTPQITSISPNPVTVGSAPVDITISGSGFVSEFVIVNKVAGASEWTSYCSYIDTQRCVFDVTSNTIRVQLYAAPQTVPGNYEFAVVNVHDPNNLIYSNPFGLVIQAQSTVLNAPLNLVATAQSSTTSSSMLLSWVDNSNNEDGFTLQYKLNTAPETAWANVPGASNLPSGNGVTMTYTHTGLTARNLYDYRVRAYVNSGNPSAWITVSGVRALDFVPQITSMSPSPVTIGSAPVTVTISGSNFVSEFSVGMRPQGSTEPWINNIYCSYVPNTGCNFVNSNTITIPIPANAAPGNYEFMVANVYNIAVPIISDPNVLTIQTQATIPNVPSGLTAVAQSSTSMLLTWTDNSLNEQGFTLQYKLSTAPETSWANVPGASNLPAGNVPGGTVTYSQTTGLVANTAYNYRVRAYNGEGPSAWYPTGVPYPTGTTLDTIPNVPSGLTATALSATSMRLNWNDNSNNEDGFTLQYKLNTAPESSWANVPGASNLPSGNGGTLTYPQTTGLVANTAYNYRVRAYNGEGPSAWYPTGVPYPTGTTLDTSPTAPTLSTVVAQSSSSVLLTWVDNSVNENGFWIGRCIGTGCTNFIGVTGATNLVPSAGTGMVRQFTDNNGGAGLTANTVYRYRVDSYNSVSPNGNSNIVSVTTFVCDNGQTRLCSEQRGVCNLASETCTGNVWPGCTATVYQSNAQTRYGVNYQVGSETLCDGRDNNCNNLIDDIAMLSAPFCSNQEGVCAGSKKSCGGVSGWSECTGVQYTANSVNYRATEVGVCRDGLDNDCDIEFDYDGAGSIKGDSDCAVSVTSINAPEQVFISSNFNLDCVSSVPNIRSVIGSLDGVSCSFVNWIESIARFDCTSSSTPRVQVAACDIDITKSYNNGGLISSDVNVVSNACNSYSTSESCEAVSGNICDWVLGCSGTRSNGFGDRCVPTGTGTGSYMCRVNSCGATCDGTVNGCSSSSICDLNSCGCVEQNPSINVNGVSPGSFAWSSNNIVVTVTGSYFASNAELLVDGNPVTVLPSTRTATSLQFNYVNRMFRSGTHSVTVRNPTSERVSNSRDFSLSSNPTISSIVPNVLSYVSGGSVEIIGTDLDPIKLMANGLEIPNVLWSSGGDRLVNLGILGGIVPGGNYDFVVVNRDNANSISNGLANRLRINWIFDYILSLSTSSATAPPQSSFDIEVGLQSVDFMDYEDVVVTIVSPPEITVAPNGEDRCKPDLTCTLSYTVNVGNVVAQDYTVTFTSTSEQTSKEHSSILTVRGDVSPPEPSGSTSGGGGGGGGSRRPKIDPAQCNDKKDNDLDGKIDYPNDLGCTDSKDNNEVNIDSIVTKGNYTFGEELEEEETPEPTENDIEIRVVFWSSVLILVIGIIVMGIFILRYLREEKGLNKLIDVIEKSNTSGA